ncbi:MAG: hypothetical protein Q7V01_09100 [Vicinamibacterales bacterium]|nr:hypothetical protein [Vicinamibacterales bacterium]
MLRPRIVLVALGLVAAAFLAHAATVRYPPSPVAFDADPAVWPGVFHVHTVASDGLGTLDDVAEAAKAAGATWVLVADHNRLDFPSGRLVKGVLMVSAPEVSALDGHVNALGVSRALTRPERKAPTALATIRSLGGTPVAAHPLDWKRPYHGLDDPALGGMEVLSADQELHDALLAPLRIVPAALSYLVNPMHGVARLIRRPAATLARWDELLATRRIMGFCAIDAHGRPSYTVMMRLLQMHVVVGRPRSNDASADGAALLDALTRGRSYCGVEVFGSAGGFRFGATVGPRVAGIGDEVALAEHPVLKVDLAYSALPRDVHPVIICGGAETALIRQPGQERLTYEFRPVRTGACRVEVRLGGPGAAAVPWIVSNPIFVR